MRDWTIVLCVAGFSLSMLWVVLATRLAIKLKARTDEAEAKVAELQMAVLEARVIFGNYEALHRAKNSPEGDRKADANRDFANAMDQALKRSHYRELSPLQTHFIISARQMRRAQDRAFRRG